MIKSVRFYTEQLIQEYDSYNTDQLSNIFFGIFATSLEYVIKLC